MPRQILKSVLILMLATSGYFPLSLAAEPQSDKPAISVAKSKHPGYEIDGRASASDIVAKRSHTPARSDEIGLAVFSGLFVIALIIFLSRITFKK